MNNEKKQFTKMLIVLAMLVFSLVSSSWVTYALPDISITSPAGGNPIYWEYEDTVEFDATITNLRFEPSHVDYVIYSLDGGSTWTDPIIPPPRSSTVIIDEQEEAENLPYGQTSFRIEVRDLMHQGALVKSDSVSYRIASVDISILSPSQNTFLDFDYVNQYASLQVYKSDEINLYIYRTSNSSWIKCRTIDTDYDDDNPHTVNTMYIHYDDLVGDYAGVSYTDLCYTTFQAKFENKFGAKSDSEILNFKVLWNSANVTPSLSQFYTGSGGIEWEIEIYYRFENMTQSEYTEVCDYTFDQYTTFSFSLYWSSSEYKHYYYNCADEDPAGWWRKDSNGDLITTENQRRYIKFFDKDPGNDDLMHIFYFWLSTDSNHDTDTQLLIDGVNCELDQTGSHGSIYWEVSRPDHEWGDYINRISFNFKFLPCRIEPGT